MRFTIRQLMLLPPVFLLNTWLVGFFAFPALRSFSWQHESNNVMYAQERIEDFVRCCNHADLTVTDQTLRDWIGHRLSSDHPTANILMNPPRPDAWGNPYRIQPRASLDEKPRVYSTGQDGRSTSDGNDPDDIRSWDEKRWQWYYRRQSTREISFCMIASAMITAAGFLLLTHGSKRTSNET